MKLQFPVLLILGLLFSLVNSQISWGEDSDFWERKLDCDGVVSHSQETPRVRWTFSWTKFNQAFKLRCSSINPVWKATRFIFLVIVQIQVNFVKNHSWLIIDEKVK